MIERLPERRAAVALTPDERAHVRVSIQVKNIYAPVGLRVPEKVTVGGLMPTAENDGQHTGKETIPNELSERFLLLDEGSTSAKIADIQRPLKDMDVLGRASTIRSHAVQNFAYVVRRMSGPYASPVGPDAVVHRKARQRNQDFLMFVRGK